MTYRCQHCGAEHAGVPLSYGVDAPVLVDTIPLDERPSRVALGTDQCIVDLKTMVHTRPVGMRPFVELEPTDHPLSVEQRNGITMARVEEIARRVAST